MAQNTEISVLVEQLIKATIKTPTEAEVERYKRSALRTFAEVPSSRVNQFDVRNRLDGLVEKARILNKDALADALHHRLQELSTMSGKWTPEILSVFLNFSDRPIHSTKVEDLVLLDLTSYPPALRWSDILADDPLDDEDGMWSDVDYAADGSDEDEVLEANESDISDHIPDPNLLDRRSAEAKLEDLTRPQDDTGFRKFVDAQFWKQKVVPSSMDELGQDKHPELILTELQTIREVVHMLFGLPTLIFILNESQNILIHPKFGIRHVARGSVTDLLQSFAEIGGKLRKVRTWNRKRTVIPLEQTFQAAIESRLGDVDRSLNKMLVKLLQPHAQFIPSLLQLYDGVCSISRLIQQVHDILDELETRPSTGMAFAILELLFDKTCANQSTGDEEGYEYMAMLFFECFQTYLRPIRSWMEMGLLGNRDQVIFIEKAEEDVPLSSTWREQYHLIQDADAKLDAPKFLHLTAKKIFNTGKSVIFLRHLGYKGDTLEKESLNARAMTFESVCQSANSAMISPFSELFDMAFDTWIADRHHSSSSILHRKLETECGLQRSLDALEYIYFFRNGALSTTVAFKLFERIGRGDCQWSDTFTLRELFQETFSATKCIDSEFLEDRSIVTAVGKEQCRANRSMATLEDLHISYLLPWPVANIITVGTLEIYRRIFVLLLQIQRAKYLLQMHRLPRNTSPTVDKPISLLCSLHHRLLWFTDVIMSYITDMVLSATTIDMRINMQGAEDVDAMIAIHEAYISLLQDRCFLTKQHGPIHQAIISLLDLTIILSDMRALYALQTDVSLGGSRTLNKARQSAPRDSDGDEDNNEADNTNGDSASNSDLWNTDRLISMDAACRKLNSYILAAVQGISKADNGPCWEMLSNTLAVGVGVGN